MYVMQLQYCSTFSMNKIIERNERVGARAPSAPAKMRHCYALLVAAALFHKNCRPYFNQNLCHLNVFQ